jgi:hypothetical protein
MESEPEKVEVKRVQPDRPVSTQPTVIERLNNALAPLVGGLVLDLADFVTFGPIGLYIGLFVGAAIGWWIGTVYRFSNAAKLLWALLAGLYCLVPTTELFPIATVISAVARFYENPRKPPQQNNTSKAENTTGEPK